LRNDVSASPRDGRTVGGKAVRNSVLLQLPEEEFQSLKPLLEFRTFETAARLESEGRPIEAIYFLNEGLGSMIIETTDGRSVEVGVAGRESMIGLSLAGGLEEVTHSVVIQVPGNGFRVPTAGFRRLLPRLTVLNQSLMRRLAIRSVELAQNAACNRLHSVKQRLARWLLLSHDRVESDFILVTHDFLSRMVGTDRPTVTLSLAELQRDSILQPGRGSIFIQNRAGLEEESCECYAVFRRSNQELGLRS
jgi:CRP-like cAMP-binding protein